MERRRGLVISALVAGAVIIAAGGALPAVAAPPQASAAPEPAVVAYEASDAIIANPERGFDHTNNTHFFPDGTEGGPGYTPLDVATLSSYRDEGITELVRVFYMERFVAEPTLDPAWLALVQADFDAAREAGISIIPRFAYLAGGEWPYEPPYGDAPLDIVLAHIEQLAPIFQNNADVISVVQAGFVGLWGEGYYTDHFVADPANPGVVTEADWAKRRAVVDALLRAVPADRSIQLRTMNMKQNILGVPTGSAGAITGAEAHDGSAISRIGHHNDCFLAAPDDWGTYLSDPIELDQEYLAAESDFVPVGGETCNVNPPRSEWETASAEMERYNFSYLNWDYLQAVLQSWGQENLDTTAKRLGYRFVMTESSIADGALSLTIRNDGWAAPYNSRPASLVLTNADRTVRVPFDADARDWAAGETVTVTASLADVPSGEYDAALSLPATHDSVAANPLFAVQTANIGTWDPVTGLNGLQRRVTIADGIVTAQPTTNSAARLPDTGTAVGPAALLGGAIVLTGGLALVLRRRRAAQI
ncbi:DUF4832 domain-containing protein [Plantibacter sp. YIM 135249]|uniref:DUF4832 domain-containing protein n=1 Tax=Plantibacter sp. YIM 135249 TaxID=3423918 RepID=UPI003D32B7D2